MEITSFALRIFVLLLPGVVCALLFEKLTIHRPWTTPRLLIHIFLFGALTYVCLSALALLTKLAALGLGLTSTWNVTFWDALFSENTTIPFSEIGLSVILALPVTYLAAAVASRELINRIGVRLGVTRKFGDSPLLYAELATLGKPLLRVWTKSGPIYEGKVQALSKENGFNEIVIEGVIVYDRRLRELYRLRRAFLSMDEANVIVEVVQEPPLSKTPATVENRSDDQRFPGQA